MVDAVMDFKEIVNEIKEIINSGRGLAYAATSKALIITYWNVGKRIATEEQNVSTISG